MENAAADAVLNVTVICVTAEDEGEGAGTLRLMVTRTAALT